MLKKVLASTLALTMVLGIGAMSSAQLLPETALSVSSETYGEYEYRELEDGTIEITEYNPGSDEYGEKTEIDVPAKIDGKQVTSIGKNVFSGYLFMHITIPAGVTNIGDYAFADCYEMTSMTLPDGVTHIGDHAFDSCIAMEKIQIPDSVTSIGERVFYNCVSLRKIKIPQGIERIGESMFWGCDSLTDVTIPDTVSRIEYEAFGLCPSLEDITIPDSVTYIGSYAFDCCDSLKKVTIPASVEEIGEHAFGYYLVYTTFFSELRYEDMVIYCYSGTAGEKYAIENGFLHTLLDAEGLPLGDINGDGTVDLTDMTLLDDHVHGRKGMTGEELVRADLNGDGLVDLADIVILCNILGIDHEEFDNGPSDPEDSEPDKPSDSGPDKPSDSEPDKPSDSEPTKPSDSEPTKPSDSEPTKPQPKKGDVNGDGIVNSADVTMLAAHVKGFTTLKDTANADVNGNKIIESADITLLAAYVKGTATF